MRKVVLLPSDQVLSSLAEPQPLVSDSRLSWVKVELSSNSPLASSRCTPPSRLRAPIGVRRTFTCPKALAGVERSSRLASVK
jgi:hypothetical protein